VNRGYGYKEYRNEVNKDGVVSVTRVHSDFECPKCGDKHKVVSFGLTVESFDLDSSETFFWCPCGHKWIEEPCLVEPSVEAR